jgi:hypothetical protein
MDTINDQENILKIRFNEKRDNEWEQIRLEMKAGSSDIIPKNNYFEDKSPLASILHELKKELQNQGDAVAEFEKQGLSFASKDIAQGWCEALEFAIKLIEGKDVQNTND